MGWRSLVATAAAGSAALAVAAAAGAADTQTGSAPAAKSATSAANAAPVARLRPRRRTIRAGRRIVLDASRSRDFDGHIAQYLWDLNGDGVFEKDSGARARVHHRYRRAGVVRISVVVVDDRGAYAVRHARIRIVGVRDAVHHRAADRRASGHAPKPARIRAATRHVKRRSPPAKTVATAAAAMAAVHTLQAASTSSGVTISDYKFAPTSVTVHVGDTVTWTNNGPTAHTATANDGSFDTGNLNKGATGQFTFTKAGTFGYHCTPHPFMKASVTVLASGSGSNSSGNNGSSGSGNSNSSGSGGSGSSNGSSLPHTGLEIASVILAGLIMLGSGLAIRRGLVRS